MTTTEDTLPGMPEPEPESVEAIILDAYIIEFVAKVQQDGQINVLDQIIRFPEDWKKVAENNPGDFEEAVSQFVWQTVDDSAEWPNDHHTLKWDKTPFDMDVDFRLPDPLLYTLHDEVTKRRLWPWPWPWIE
jgi:hypothetical protein